MPKELPNLIFARKHIPILYTPAFLQGNGGETAAHTGGAERQRPAEWNRLLHAVPPPQGDPWYGLRTEIKNFT